MCAVRLRLSFVLTNRALVFVGTDNLPEVMEAIKPVLGAHYCYDSTLSTSFYSSLLERVELRRYDSRRRGRRGAASRGASSWREWRTWSSSRICAGTVRAFAKAANVDSSDGADDGKGDRGTEGNAVTQGADFIALNLPKRKLHPVPPISRR